MPAKALLLPAFLLAEQAYSREAAKFVAAATKIKPPQAAKKSTRSVPSRQGHRRKAAKEAAKPPKGAAKRRRKARGACCPEWGKGFNWVCAKFLFCGLIRGLQNLEAPFGKGFNFVRAKPLLRRAESRFAKPRNFPERETVLFFSLVRKEPKVPQRFANLWTPGTIQSSVGEDFSRVFRRHEPNPVFRTKRRRKGFESVRGSGVTA